MSEEMLPKDVVHEIAESAARSALASFFKFLDVDLDNQEDVRALREDLTYIRSQRVGTENLKRKINQTAWTALPLVLTAWLFWMVGIFKEGAREAILHWITK